MGKVKAKNMNRKYTKGPWLLSTIDGEDTLMVGGGDGSDVVADIRTDRKEEEVEANAHLIASAPELYESLKALLTMSVTFFSNLESMPHFVTSSPKYDRLMHCASEAKAAICHAEGRDATND